MIISDIVKLLIVPLVSAFNFVNRVNHLSLIFFDLKSHACSGYPHLYHVMIILLSLFLLHDSIFFIPK